MVASLGATRAADRSHLATRRTPAEEALPAIGFEPGHLHSGWHVELLEHPAALRIDSPQVALAFFQRAVPELAIDPGHAGDEAVGFDRAQNFPRLRVDLMDLAITVLPDPERPLRPCEARVTAPAGCRDGGKHLPGLRINLVDALLRDLKEMPPVEGCPGMRRHGERAQCLAARRIEGAERV